MNIFQFTAESHLGPGTESHAFVVPSLTYASPLHCHDFYEFFLITKGKAIHVVNRTRVPLVEGNLVFIRPDDVHGYSQDGDSDCAFMNVCYRKEGMERAFHFLGEAVNREGLLSPALPPMTQLNTLEKEQLAHRLEQASVDAGGQPKLREVLLRGILIDMLVRHFRPFQEQDDEKRLPLWFKTLLDDMQRKEHFTEGLPRMIELSGRSQGHLNRLFKQRLGTTPVAYVNGLKLQYSKHLLATTQISITDVALIAGFNNLSHYYHLFKAEFNMTPAEFRARQKLPARSPAGSSRIRF